jgi:hypothetical protein
MSQKVAQPVPQTVPPRVLSANVFVAGVVCDHRNVPTKVADRFLLRARLEFSKPRQQLHKDFTAYVFDSMGSLDVCRAARRRLQLLPYDTSQHWFGGASQEKLEMLLRFLFIRCLQEGQEEAIYRG